MSNKIRLKDAVKSCTSDQDKILHPKETVTRFLKKLSQIDLDILRSTERIDNGRLDIPVYFSYCGKDAISCTGTKKQMGKGATPHQAKASALMELAERFSFFNFVKNPDNFLIENQSNLKDKAIPFEMIAKSVHDSSKDLDRAKTIFENLNLKWTQGYNLSEDKKTLIPFDWFFAINEFNGPSAGNCPEEAICQGICEIVERHVCAIISRKKIKAPAIQAESSEDPLVQNMLKKYKKAGIKLYVSDFSLETGIPTISVLAYDPSTVYKTSEIVWTAGTTPCPDKALSRALAETAQLAGDFNTGSNYVASGLPKIKTIDDANFIIDVKDKKEIKTLPDLSNNNIKIEIINLLSALRKKNMEVFVIDTMHPQLEVPAFYTIIPGAHFRERAAATSVGMFSAKLIYENNNAVNAINQLIQAEKILPGKYYIRFYLGLCHMDIGDPDKALSFLKQAIDLEPTPEDIPTIYSYMGSCLKDMGEYKKAIVILQKGERYDKERADIYNLMGFCHFKLHKYQDAINCFQKILDMDPSSGINYANIASNYRELGEKKKAVQYYKIALSIDPKIDFARINLAKLLE